LVLCYLEGRTQDEAARTLGWSRTTFRRRLEEGRRRLADRLARRGVTLSAGLLAVLLPEQAAAGTPVLIRSAVKACLSSTTDGATFGAAALAEGVLSGTAPTRWKTWLLLAVVLGVLTVGAGLADRREGPRVEPEAQAKNRTGREPQRADGVDRLGDPLPPGAMARLGADRFRLGGPGYHLVASPDGKSLFSCAGGREILSDDDKTELMWDTRTGRQVRRFEGHEHLVMSLALAPDGKTLASGSADGTVRLWDVATGKQRHRIAIRGDFPRTRAFSPA